jgi:hypothetical protein
MKLETINVASLGNLTTSCVSETRNIQGFKFLTFGLNNKIVHSVDAILTFPHTSTTRLRLSVTLESKHKNSNVSKGAFTPRSGQVIDCWEPSDPAAWQRSVTGEVLLEVSSTNPHIYIIFLGKYPAGLEQCTLLELDENCGLVGVPPKPPVTKALGTRTENLECFRVRTVVDSFSLFHSGKLKLGKIQRTWSRHSRIHSGVLEAMPPSACLVQYFPGPTIQELTPRVRIRVRPHLKRVRVCLQYTEIGLVASRVSRPNLPTNVGV